MLDVRAVRRMCGQLVVGGFEGTSLPESFARALAAGERGGAVLFSRNLTQDPLDCVELARAITKAAAINPLVAIDQEGGRVQRLKPPVLQLPPMRALGKLPRDGARGALTLVHDAAKALGAQLHALGFTMDFAPVADLDTCATNPIIGDRSFGGDPETVEVLARTYARGLEASHVRACMKHFPGHGDTTKDSHLDLPVVTLARPKLTAHITPFLQSPRYHAAIMTAHVVYTAIDPDLPATLSPEALGIARRFGAAPFDGCIVSDDLEMKAIADRWPIEESAPRAIAAGCDALLVCKSEELQERAVAALAKRASEDGEFHARCQEAYGRFVGLRRRSIASMIASRSGFDAASAPAREVEARLAALRETP